MACETWRGKLDAYLDGELAATEARALSAHLRSCAPCAEEALQRAQVKRFAATGGKRELDTQSQAGISKSVATRPPHQTRWEWKILVAPALVLVIFSVAINLYVGRAAVRRQRVYRELIGLHVAALANATHVDVLSNDPHTVKAWFQGKLPFTFNLPELQGSEFVLLEGRGIDFAGTPGAHLIYQAGTHNISVFIFQDRGTQTAILPSGPVGSSSFVVENWSKNGLRYFVVAEVSPDEIQALSKLLRDAG